ncbi:MarR family transcriptional regulator [Xylanimonas allomyrinae]|uniref:MarR family transcriptional regulator n=1 Tax=Xylanimonas allomyrinae TaxID=2509459 RepID=A0A4P6ELG0_9MICO|nr:MarR family transcriptional regulator [Xylanimonas allomyrinae]QAY63096.1 MarR family transcriptional regulator [Xylanimonas allomyrinae]
MSASLTPDTESRLAPSELRYLVLAAQREGSREVNRRLADLKLTASQAEIILVLREFGPITLKELGGLIVCEAGSPSRIVDTLVRRGLVVRTQDTVDRRAVSIELSESGRALVSVLKEIDHAINAGALAQLAHSQLDGLVSSLRLYLADSESHDVLERRFAAKRRPVSEF